MSPRLLSLNVKLGCVIRGQMLFPMCPQHWEAFRFITEIFILVPALLGLKGNLEMTLASRLSTAVSHSISSFCISVSMMQMLLSECAGWITFRKKIPQHHGTGRNQHSNKAVQQDLLVVHSSLPTLSFLGIPLVSTVWLFSAGRITKGFYESADHSVQFLSILILCMT